MIAGALMILLAAAPAAGAGLAALQADDRRVATVAWRLQTANVALCPTLSGYISGLSIHALSQYAAALRPQVRVQFGLSDRVAIAAVATGSQAARAGLQIGDAIVRVDGLDTPAISSSKLDYGPVAAVEAQIETALLKPPALLLIERGADRVTVPLEGDAGCVSRVQIVPGEAINAEADGQYVQISDAVLGLAQSDDALATILGHELAHNLLGHRARLDAAKVSRGIFAGLGRNGAKLRATEYEADRLGVWLMARAGFDAGAVVPFWRQLARSSGGGFLSDGTHPSWKERLKRLSKAVAEVKAQQVAGLPLVPPAQ